MQKWQAIRLIDCILQRNTRKRAYIWEEFWFTILKRNINGSTYIQQKYIIYTTKKNFSNLLNNLKTHFKHIISILMIAKSKMWYFIMPKLWEVEQLFLSWVHSIGLLDMTKKKSKKKSIDESWLKSPKYERYLSTLQFIIIIDNIYWLWYLLTRSSLNQTSEENTA